MGGLQKALMTVDGRAIIDRQLDVLTGRFERVAIALAEPDADRSEFEARSLECLFDSEQGRGPLAGLAAARTWAGPAHVVVVACDMPYIGAPIVELLIERARSADLVVPRVAGRVQPLLAAYGPRTTRVIMQALEQGELRLVELPDKVRAAGCTVDQLSDAEIRTFDPELRSFTNINQPSDVI